MVVDFGLSSQLLLSAYNESLAERFLNLFGERKNIAIMKTSLIKAHIRNKTKFHYHSIWRPRVFKSHNKSNFSKSMEICDTKIKRGVPNSMRMSIPLLDLENVINLHKS